MPHPGLGWCFELRAGRSVAAHVPASGGGAVTHTIVLVHGQHASWTLRYTDPGAINCKPENAVSMIVYPLDNFLPVLAQKGERACKGNLKYESPLVFGG